MVSRGGVVEKRARSAPVGSSRSLEFTISYRWEHHCIDARELGRVSKIGSAKTRKPTPTRIAYSEKVKSTQ